MNQYAHTATSASSPSQPVTIVTTEDFLSSLRQRIHAQYGFLDEPEETLSQLEAVIHLMSGCFNPEGTGFSVTAENMHWTMLLALDLIKEIERRMEQERAYQKSTEEELERHLETCHLIPASPGKWAKQEEEGEVAA